MIRQLYLFYEFYIHIMNLKVYYVDDITYKHRTPKCRYNYDNHVKFFSKKCCLKVFWHSGCWHVPKV